MSCTELITGKIKKIGDMSETEAENYCKEQCKQLCPEKYEDVIKNGFKCYEHSWIEILNDALYHKKNITDFYIYRNNALYLAYDKIEHEVGSFYVHMEKTPDGEYNYITQFYNGGTCLEEILDEEIDKLKNDAL